MIEVPAFSGDAPQTTTSATEGLEQRVRRLEDAVAALQDTGPLETRVAERVAARIGRGAAPAGGESAAILIEAGRHLLPAARELPPRNDDAADAPYASPADAPRQPWLVWDVFAEARTILRMFVDPRYRMAWSARIIPLALCAMILTSWAWLPGTGILGALPAPLSWLAWILDKTVDLILAFFLYKILSREARRYRLIVPNPSRLP